VVNNAGYALMGDTEAAPDEAARKQLDTNFWGTVDVSKEAVRVMREVNGKNGGRIGGTVVQVSSMGGWVAFPGNAFYHARFVAPFLFIYCLLHIYILAFVMMYTNSRLNCSKFAVEGFTESFAKEMHSDWNINFLIIEPGE
jgi:NAD(P)-dependent dehydrogenase (short-subunit alcohol dehydrogenase family)